MTWLLALAARAAGKPEERYGEESFPRPARVINILSFVDTCFDLFGLGCEKLPCGFFDGVVDFPMTSPCRGRGSENQTKLPISERADSLRWSQARKNLVSLRCGRCFRVGLAAQAQSVCTFSRNARIRMSHSKKRSNNRCFLNLYVVKVQVAEISDTTVRLVKETSNILVQHVV